MRTRRLPPTRIVLGAALLVALMPAAHACATCFGASDSKMAQGMNLGILTLLGVVAVVLAGLAGFVVTLAVRSTRASHEPDPATGVKPGVRS
jgi:hypothetical protein